MFNLFGVAVFFYGFSLPRISYGVSEKLDYFMGIHLLAFPKNDPERIKSIIKHG